jgi:hypothetical protein
VVTVISELRQPLQDTLLPDSPPPFERQVTERLTDALAATKEAAQLVLNESHELDAFEERVGRGVSANLCEAVAQIGSDEGPASVEVTVDWAASWLRDAQGAPAEVEFDPGEIDVVERAAEHLRRQGPYEDVQVGGYVRQLDRGTVDPIGTIIIEGIVAGRRRNVHVDLAGEAYSSAIAAHDDRAQVTISGTLAKRGRHWVLEQPGDLQIVDGF